MLPTFEVFGLTLPMFGVMMMLGMVAAFALLLRCRKYIPFTEDDLLSAALWAIILGFLGSKILFWIVEFKQVLADPHYLLETLREGFVFYGSLIGGILGLIIFSHRKKLPFFAFADLFIPSLALGQAFGRIGCFLAGCCYGSPSSCAIAVTYPPGAVAPAGIPLLPTQLMESAFLFVLTVVLVALMKRHKPFGTVTGWYLIFYGVWRFIIEFFRSDARGAVGALSTSQFIGIFIVLSGIVLLLLVKKKVLTRCELDDPDDNEADELLFPDDAAEPEVTQDEMVLLVQQATAVAADKAVDFNSGSPAAADSVDTDAGKSVEADTDKAAFDKPQTHKFAGADATNGAVASEANGATPEPDSLD